MIPLLITFLGVLLVPLFVGTWRTSLLGLACQGAIMAWLAYRQGADPSTLSGAITLIDLGVLRGVVAPVALYRVLSAHDVSARNDVLPPNLLAWTLALAAVLIAFNFAPALVPDYGDQRVLVAVVTSALLLGFLVLSTQVGTFSQIVGALRIENAIALFELGGGHEHGSVGIKAGQSAVVLVTILLYRWYLAALVGPAAGVTSADAPESQTI